MRSKEFIDELDKAGFEVHRDAVLDALWLASLGRVLSLPLEASAGPVPPAPISDSHLPPKPAPADPNKLKSGDDGDDNDRDDHDEDQGDGDPVDGQGPGLFAHGNVAGEDMTIHASAILLPSAHALVDRLPLLRALRPFRRQFPSLGSLALDEERTVELTAETWVRGARRVMPVLKPAFERWYDAHIVIENDPAIEVWAAPLREFAQLLRNAGAFRQVRTWRLRLDEAEPTKLAGARLETPAGGLSSPRELGNSRSLVFFASHGNSPHWADGVYTQLIASWPAASVALLHLMPRQRWAHTFLGEPQGLAHTIQPGCANPTLQVDPFWWRAAPDPQDKRVVRLPAVAIEPASFEGWARMQMALGRQAEVFLLNPADKLTVEAAAQLTPAQMEVELALTNLRERSPQAYDLAIMLVSAPFTLPVARLVQEVTQDDGADFSVLAELMVSGLVAPRTGETKSVRETTYFEIRDDARPLLQRALRNADAEALANSLDQRISKHLTDIAGRSVQFSALVATADGEARLPDWAKPFAHLTTALRAGHRPAPEARDWRQIMEALSPSVIGRLARLSAAGRAMDPHTVRSDLWPYLDNPRFAEPAEAGGLRFLPVVASYLRERLADAPSLGLRLLWVDDLPKNNADLVVHLEEGGAEPIALAFSTEEALARPDLRNFDVIISDMSRGDNHRAGYDLLTALRELGVQTPLLFFAGYAMQSEARRNEAVAAGAFGGTNDSDELLELLHDAAEAILFRAVQEAPVPEPEPAPEPAPDLKLRPLDQIPSDDFCTFEEIANQLRISNLIVDGQGVVGRLLVFQTRKQKTWLFATGTNIIFILDDANTRAAQMIIQRIVPLAEVQPITAEVHPDGSAVFQLGDRTARPWYYSQSLFPSASRIQDAIYALLDNAISLSGTAATGRLSPEQAEARRALIEIGIDCSDTVVLDIVYEGARFQPQPGYSQPLSMSRLLCGAMMVADRLPGQAQGNSLLHALSAVLNSPSWQPAWNQLLRGFHRDGSAEASRRLRDGFSRNARRALTLAASQAGSGTGLDSDILVRTLLTPDPEYRSSMLYRAIPNMDALRRSVEAYRDDRSPRAAEREPPSKVWPPQPSRLGRRYCREIQRALGALATFPPNIQVSLGDIGELRDGVFFPAGNLRSLAANFALSTHSSSTSNIAFTSRGVEVSIIDGRAVVDFRRADGILLRLQGCRWTTLDNLEQIAEAELTTGASPTWQGNWHVVTQVLEAEQATIVLAEAANSRAVFVSKTGGFTAEAFPPDVEMAGSSGVSFNLIARSRSTPLFQLARTRLISSGSPKMTPA